MRITVFGRPAELSFQTITLSPNLKDPANVYLLRCYRCGHQLAKVQGVVSSVLPGFVPSSQVLVTHQCTQCRELYVLQTQIKTTQSPTRIVLAYSPIHIHFHCLQCPTVLGTIMQNGLLDARGHRLQLPAHLKCPVCPADYTIQDVLSNAKMEP